MKRRGLNYYRIDNHTTLCYYIAVVCDTIYQTIIKERRDYLDNLTEMLKGALEGCILEIISRGKTYGYEITSSLRQLGFTDIVEGTVYTILVRLEKNRFVSVERQPSEIGPPRKFYMLTKAGRKELHHFWAKWNFVSSKINKFKEK